MSRHHDEQTALLGNRSTDNQDNQKKYRAISRFFAQELSLSALLLRISYAICLHKNLAGHRLPLSNNMGRRLSNLYQNIIDGSDLVISTVWSPAFFVLLMNDLRRYVMEPTNRYGITLADIFLGTANNEDGPSFSSNLGSNVVSDEHFFTGAAVLLASWVLSMVAYTLYRRHWHSIPRGVNTDRLSASQAAAMLMHDMPLLHQFDRAFQSQFLQNLFNRINHDTTSVFLKITLLSQLAHQLNPNDLSGLSLENAEQYATFRKEALAQLQHFSVLSWEERGVKNYFISAFARFHLWAIGEQAFSWLHPLYFAHHALTLYAAIRFFQIVIRKAQQSWQFDTEECVCHANELAWSYMQLAGEYLCTVCGDWDFVPFKERNNAQACMDALLAQPLTVTIMEQTFKRFSNTSHISAIDFDLLNWRNWTANQANQFLTGLAQAVSHTVVNVSLAAPYFVGGISHDIMTQLTQFFSSLTLLAHLSLDYLDLAEFQMRHLVGALINPLQTLSVAEMQMSDDVFQALFNETRVLSQLIDFNVRGNRLTDASMMQLFQQFPNALLKLNVANNAFSDIAYPVIAQMMTRFRLAQLDISGNVLGDAAAQTIGQALATTTLTQLSMTQMQIDDTQLLAIAQSLAASTLTKLNLAFNQISLIGIAGFMKYLVNASLTHLTLSDNAIGDDGFAVLMQSLNQTQLQFLQLANTKLTGSYFPQFVNTSVTQQPLALDLSHNLLTEESLIALANWISSGNLAVSALCLNAIWASSAGFIALFAALPHTIEYVDVSHNLVNQTAIDALLHFIKGNSVLKMLRIENIGMQGPQAMALAEILPHTQITHLVLNGNPIGDAGAQAIAQHLVQPELLRSQHLGDEQVPRDQLHNWFANAKPNTLLKVLEVNDAGIGASGARALCRVKQLLPSLQSVSLLHNAVREINMATCAYQAVNALQQFVQTSPPVLADLLNSTDLNTSCHQMRDHILLFTLLGAVLMLLAATIFVTIGYSSSTQFFSSFRREKRRDDDDSINCGQVLRAQF